MAKYLFIYHGGKKPDNAQDAAKAMDNWGKWFGSLGASVIDGGNPVGKSYTVLSDGSVAANGGSNPVSGYGLFEAKDLDDALNKAKGCPLLDVGGSVEVAIALDM